MLANPPLVPSRDALRLLRQLAFAGSTLAAIGIVTLNYNVHHRIRLAEQRLETKKQIRALSNGTREAYIARVIEAAENGQDFSIQAMREHKTKERHIRQPRTASSEGKASNKRTACNSQRLHIEPGFRERYTRPARDWPAVESSETEVLQTAASPARRNIEYGSGEQAAEKIKRATMAMTSTAPAHVYGRPKRAIPKARPNLHYPVASWLGTASDTEQSAETTPSSTDSSSTRSPVETNSQQSYPFTSPSTNTIEPAAYDGLLTSQIISTKKSLGSKFDGAPTIQVDEKQTEGGPRQNISSEGIDSENLHRSNHGNDVAARSHDNSFVCSEEASMLPKNHSTSNEMNAEANTHCATPVSDEMPNADSGRHRSHVLPAKVNPLHSCAGEVGSLVDSRLSAQSMWPLETVSAKLHSHRKPKKNGKCPIDQPTARAAAVAVSTTSAKNASPKWQPDYDIRLRQEPMEAPQPHFVSWPHLQFPATDKPSEGDENISMFIDENVAGEQQQQSKDNANAESEETLPEQHQSKQNWSPFPRAPRTRKWTIDHRNIDILFAQDQASSSVDQRKELSRSETDVHMTFEDAQAMPTMTAEGKANLVHHIRNIFASDGATEGQRAWNKAARLRIYHEDYVTLDFLYTQFVEKGIMTLSSLHDIFQSLMQWHFEKSRYSARAAEMLFPDPQPGPNGSVESNSDGPTKYLSLFKENRLRWTFAVTFLQGVWDTDAHPDSLLLNFRRIVVAAKLRGVKLDEQIFASVIQKLASIGSMSAAQVIFDEMTFYHQIEASFLSQAVLLRGYARKGEWHRVEREIESLHIRGLSRRRPHGYALMISAILQEYAARSSVGHFQNFLINAVSYWGLIPTSAVSTTAVWFYLSHQRYDLVKEWMETLQVLFPQIDTETATFRWVLANSWQSAGANCQEIEDAIKSVAYRNPRTRLKSRSLPMVHEALCRDLAVKLDAAKAKTELKGQPSTLSNTENKDFISAQTLDEYLTSAFSLTASKASQNKRTPQEVIDLYHQAAAVQRLNTFLTGATYSKAVDQFSFPDPQAKSVDNNSDINRNTPTITTNLFHLQATIPTILTLEFLPSTANITAAILNFYHTRSFRKLPTDHALLLSVCEKLWNLNRAFDAKKVIRDVYKDEIVRRLAGLGDESHAATSSFSIHTQGVVGFGIQFYEFWMRLASSTHSLSQWKIIVEEVIRLSSPTRILSQHTDEASKQQKKHVLSTINITSAFVSLTRGVAARVLRPRWERLRTGVPRGTMEEVEWLVQKLEDRREGQIGRSEGEREFLSPKYMT
jgi:hypothetical protein